MLSRPEYIRKSLETNLFWARIMKEHALFLEAGFVCKDVGLIKEAKRLKQAFTDLLAETICLAGGIISNGAMSSGEFVTQNTLAAEKKTQNLTGIPIDLSITAAELNLTGNQANPHSPQLEQNVYMLNQKAISLSAAIVDFKGRVYQAMVSCTIFTSLFPLLIDHIRREAILYNSSLQKLQAGQDPHDPAQAAQLEAFWNRIMAEHSLFIRNYLDPTQEELFQIAQAFATDFKELTAEALAAINNQTATEAVTAESLQAARSVKDFNKQGTELILMCKIKSIILPLLGDHVTREANHYVNMLQSFQKVF